MGKRMNQINGYLENSATALKASGTAAAGNSSFSAAADHVHPTFVAAPASASADGVKGQMACDGSYLYICTATDTWKRVAISTWS